VRAWCDACRLRRGYSRHARNCSRSR
jgi:hypothetical protein